MIIKLRKSYLFNVTLKSVFVALFILLFDYFLSNFGNFIEDIFYNLNK